MIKIQQAITFKQETHYTRMGAGVDLMLLLDGHSVYYKDIYIFRRGILEKKIPQNQVSNLETFRTELQA